MNKTLIIMLCSCLALVVLDVLTGMAKAYFIEHNLKSSKMKQGIINKTVYLVAIIISFIFKYVSKCYIVNINIPSVEVISTYIIITELISISENLNKINPSFNILKLNTRQEESDSKK